MADVIPWLLVAPMLALLAFLLLRKKTSTASKSVVRDWDSDLILDRGQKRLYMAMQQYLLDERKEELQWRVFEFFFQLPREVRVNLSAAEKAVAKEFKIDRREASRNLARVFDALRTVKKRSNAPNL